ncbi:MAG: HtaA domain-containing protein, partial [Rhodoglobus sp.]
MSIFRARGLRICLLGPAAVIVTALAIALAPPTANVIAATNTATCSVSDAAITWGVKESLRSYISGTIAHGEWTVSDGASYSTPNFGWSDGAGALNAGRGT